MVLCQPPIVGIEGEKSLEVYDTRGTISLRLSASSERRIEVAKEISLLLQDTQGTSGLRLSTLKWRKKRKGKKFLIKK